MTSISYDVSKTIDPGLKTLLIAVSNVTAATDVPWFLVGAMARDLILEQVHGISAGRRTRDVDLGIMIEDWAHYQSLKETLLQTTEFSQDPHRVHRLLYREAIPVDLIPFGAVESPSGKITWPPENDIEMRVTGFADAHRCSLTLHIAEDYRIPAVSLAGLMMLKLVAWEDRNIATPGKDAPDITLLLSTYSDAGNLDRLYDDHEDILNEEDFNLISAGARLLGRDLVTISSRETRQLIIDILDRETDSSRSERLVTDLARFLPDRDPGTALLLLNKLWEGVTNS